MVYALDLCAFGISFAHGVSNMGRTCSYINAKKRMDRNGSKVIVGMAGCTVQSITTTYSQNSKNSHKQTI